MTLYDLKNDLKGNVLSNLNLSSEFVNNPAFSEVLGEISGVLNVDDETAKKIEVSTSENQISVVWRNGEYREYETKVNIVGSNGSLGCTYLEEKPKYIGESGKAIYPKESKIIMADMAYTEDKVNNGIKIQNAQSILYWSPSMGRRSDVYSNAGFRNFDAAGIECFKEKKIFEPTSLECDYKEANENNMLYIPVKSYNNSPAKETMTISRSSLTSAHISYKSATENYTTQCHLKNTDVDRYMQNPNLRIMQDPGIMPPAKDVDIPPLTEEEIAALTDIIEKEGNEKTKEELINLFEKSKNLSSHQSR